MIAGLFINEWSFIGLFIIIMLGCIYEFAEILKKIYNRKYLWYLPLAFLYIVMPILMMISLGITGDIYFDDNHGNIADQLSYSALIPCGIIFPIWINDTMAYIVGSMIGKTTLSKISPKKTWEGTIGGALLCIIVTALLGHYIPAAKLIGWQHWLCIAAICAVFGTLGDLLQSKMKRMAGVKDSGHFMPGHGGFLDRFDSLLIATPFVWLYINFII
jgi:phosphatidate cytidylyltransferase